MFKELSDHFISNVSMLHSQSSVSLPQAQFSNIHGIEMTEEAKVITKLLFVITSIENVNYAEVEETFLCRF